MTKKKWLNSADISRISLYYITLLYYIILYTYNKLYNYYEKEKKLKNRIIYVYMCVLLV